MDSKNKTYSKVIKCKLMNISGCCTHTHTHTEAHRGSGLKNVAYFCARSTRCSCRVFLFGTPKISFNNFSIKCSCSLTSNNNMSNKQKTWAN